MVLVCHCSGSFSFQAEKEAARQEGDDEDDEEEEDEEELLQEFLEENEEEDEELSEEEEEEENEEEAEQRIEGTIRAMYDEDASRVAQIEVRNLCWWEWIFPFSIEAWTLFAACK